MRGKTRQPVRCFKVNDTSSAAALPLFGLYHSQGLTLWTIRTLSPPLAFEGNTCVCEQTQLTSSPGEQGEWMTSVHEGWAGGKRGTAEHGLPSLVNGVSDQTLPRLLKCGGDERLLDRMRTKQGRWSIESREGFSERKATTRERDI